ncbi:MAG: hypothetical protein AB9915_00170 [Candidatus Dojkabacteria bacterium]
MLTDPSVPPIKAEEEKRLDSVIQVAFDILNYRLETLGPDKQKYKNLVNREITDLYRFRNGEQTSFPAGILNEALFFIACKDNLPINIAISTGEEDVYGVDFYLGPKSLPIDVTTNRREYPRKLKKRSKVTIILPGIFSTEDLSVDTREFLLAVYNLNMEILNNRYADLNVLVKTEKRKKGKKTKKSISLATSFKYGEKEVHEATDRTRKMRMDKGRHDELIRVLSMIKNFNL